MAFFGLSGFFLGVLCVWRLLVFLGSLSRTRLGLHWCASWWGHHLRNLWGEYFKVHKTADKYLGICVCFMMWKPKMLASAGQPSLHGHYACMVFFE